MQSDLFMPASDSEEYNEIPDLIYRPDFLNHDEAVRVVTHIDRTEWNTELRRRVQHYGYRYDYRARSISENMRAADLPPWAVAIGNRLVKHGLFDVHPDQVIVNEYLLGQGIAAHVDCVPCFGDKVASVSFLSPCVMTFTDLKAGNPRDVTLFPGSAVILAGRSRYELRHAIAARDSDVINGVEVARTRRISATFRTVILNS